jgi:hypothetical protein
MSGLLQRLAKQAMGGGDSRVRATAQARLGERLDVATGDQPVVARDPERNRAVDRNPSQRVHLPSTRTDLAPESDHIRAIEPSRTADRPPHEQAASLRTRQGTAESAPVAEPPALISAGDAGDGPHIGGREVAGPSLAVELAADRLDASATIPARLLDDEYPPRRPAIRGTPSTSELQSPSARPLDAEPTEVHVHIGRIEVTAVQAPEPIKRAKAPAARKSKSLEDYLAQRRAP